MKGVNHIITNIATAVIIDTGLRAVSYSIEYPFYAELCKAVNQPFCVTCQQSSGQLFVGIVVVLVNIFMFIFGTLLPDCDMEKSIMGRMLYVPVQHRTWTHTFWCVMIFTVMGFAASCFLWLAYGYTLHIFYDSLSKGGICWFYPISKYNKKTSGAQVKKNHKIYLYRTGKTSETILMTLISSIGFSMLIYAIHLTKIHKDLPFHAEWILGVNLG